MSNPTQTNKAEMDRQAQEFYAYMLEWMQANAAEAADIETVNSLSGITSILAVYDLGGVRKTVRLPLEIFLNGLSITDENIIVTKESLEKDLAEGQTQSEEPSQK